VSQGRSIRVVIRRAVLDGRAVVLYGILARCRRRAVDDGRLEILIYLTRAVPTTMEVRNLTSRGIPIGTTRLLAAVSEGDPKRRDERRER
jgi:hypothetical protein